VKSLELWGIEQRYRDAFGKEREIGEETRVAVLGGMGLDPAAVPAPDPTRVVVLEPGRDETLGGPGTLTVEDGGRVAIGADGVPPPDLPFGYHRFVPAGEDQPLLVLASPGACYLPDDFRTWGWAVQLYAARSGASWGIGDLADLATLGRWTRELGGGVMMVNPLVAATPLAPIEPSPYYPSSRRFRNPLYLRIEDLDGAAAAGPELAELARRGHALNGNRHIDRDQIFPLKMRALELLWSRFGGDAAFDAYRREQSPALDQFAAYCALAERHGRDWRVWPVELRQPTTGAVRELIAKDARVTFHAWVQWHLDQQLARASREVGIIQDLPIGLDIAGADAWCWQDLVAPGISVGCPPDEFNVDGQEWGLAPFVPRKLRAAGYAPFIETIRASLRHAGGLRIDHVMGLFRLFWIPHQLGAKGGTYVRYPVDELMAITAIESHRARAIIVGEDLGTVVPGSREVLAARNMLSYRLLYFEPTPPEEFPELALSGVTTHDLATIAGVWTDAAVAHARIAGIRPNIDGLKYLKDKLAKLSDLPPTAPVRDVILATHAALGRTPSRVLLATLDDALEVAEQPNMPGTTTSWPNWSLALPQPVEQIVTATEPREIAARLSRPALAPDEDVGGVATGAGGK
jgi:4-alpha-glucanotransferase